MAAERTSPLPDDLRQALSDAGLLDTFEALPASHQAEYLQWIDEARREETRRRRIGGTVDQLSAV